MYKGDSGTLESKKRRQVGSSHLRVDHQYNFFLTVGDKERGEEDGPKGFQHNGWRCRRRDMVGKWSEGRETAEVDHKETRFSQGFEGTWACGLKHEELQCSTKWLEA